MKILFLVLLSFVNIFSQNESLNDDSKLIINAFDDLEINPTSKEFQINYIISFPKNWNTFLSVFQPEDFSQLYNNYTKYIGVLDSLIQFYPEQIGKILINLASEAKWEADATGEIQHLLARFASNDPETFSKILKLHSKTQIDNAIEFLADVENYNAYKEYPEIISKLRKLEEYSLADRFEKAKERRINFNH
jgi:hypothetical protein